MPCIYLNNFNFIYLSIINKSIVYLSLQSIKNLQNYILIKLPIFTIGHKSDQKIVKIIWCLIGIFFIIIWQNYLMLYLWLSLQQYQGDIFITDFQIISTQLQKAIPTYKTVIAYWGFIILQIILAFVMPGPVIKGLPVPSQNNKQYQYHCNSLYSWYFTLAVVYVLYYTGIFSINFLMHNFQSMKVTFNELFLLTISAALKQYEQNGYITNRILIMIIAHFLYANACMKGQQYVATTWDIFYYKFGWMLILWNISGVPYVYCFKSIYLLKNLSINYSLLCMSLLIIVLLFVYYNLGYCTKSKKQIQNESKKVHILLDFLSHSCLMVPYQILRYLQTESGSALLIDGWWKYARKIHYTCDINMASIWALSCKFTGILPFYYPVLFIIMILHRYGRDQQGCKGNYEKDWDKYCNMVKYSFIPYMI